MNDKPQQVRASLERLRERLTMQQQKSGLQKLSERSAWKSRSSCSCGGAGYSISDQRDPPTFCDCDVGRAIKAEFVERFLNAGWSEALSGFTYQNAGAVMRRHLDNFSGVAGVLARQFVAFGHVPGERKSFGLYLYGPHGTGKTTLACTVMREIILNYAMPSLFVNAFRLKELFWSLSSSGDIAQLQFINHRMSTVPLLVIDDIGIENATAGFVAGLLAVLDARYNRSMRTIFTSNFDLDVLRSYLNGIAPGSGDSVVSRIAGMSIVAPMTGDDMRL